MDKNLEFIKNNEGAVCVNLVFDKSNCYYEVSADGYNEYFLAQQIAYLKELCKHRGYLYLNQIYETFSIPWNTSNENWLFNAQNLNIEYSKIEGTGDYNIFIRRTA